MQFCHKVMLSRFVLLIFVMSIAGCTSIIEPIKIPDLDPNPKLQEDFSVDLEPLTLAAAKELNLQHFPRFISLPGIRESATLIDEKAIGEPQFPPKTDKFFYLLGVGDEITFIQSVNTPLALGIPSFGTASSAAAEGAGGIQLSDNEQAIPVLTPSTSSIVSTTGRIGSDGSLLLLGVGRLEAKGRPISDLRDEVRNILIQNGRTPDFQFEITRFNSQKAYVSTDLPANQQPARIKFIVPITDKAIPLREIVATAGVPFNEKIFTLVKIQRGGETYSFSLADLFSETAPQIFLKDKDHVFIQNLSYVDAKVFLVGGVLPKVIRIQPELRPTLAEILFSSNGPLQEPSAQRSAVYLLRGQSPIKAYHLDAQNPARLLVADSVEMRPGDIVYVAEQPINTFNRMLSTILPFRIFSRDIKSNNIP